MSDRLNILVVDGDHAERTRIVAALTSGRLNLVVREASDGTEAMALLNRQIFDCIFADERACRADDGAFLTNISPANHAAPVVVLADEDNEESLADLLDKGAADYLVKGALSAEQLIHHVRWVVRTRRMMHTSWYARELQKQEHKWLAERESQLREQAEASKLAKDRFLAVLSHELRTPLTPVLSLVEILRNEEGLRPQAREAVEMIGRNVELEARLIDDLLDLTRSQRGILQLNRRLVDAHELLAQSGEICAPEISRKRIAWSMDLSAPDHHVDADAARLQQVFWNLIRNAVKFTQHGGRIEVRTRNEGAQSRSATDNRPATVTESRADDAPQTPAAMANLLIIEVVDTGIGIDPEAMGRIFAAFEQGHGAILRRTGGLGLGLTISKALVEAHGGYLEGFSQGRDKGATFRVTLSATAHPQADSQAVEMASAGDEATPGRHILLVDDHADTSRAMKRLLQRMGYTVETADSVQTALRAASEAAASHRKFDLLISDIGLPDGTGLELMRQIRQVQQIKGIALSGYGMDEDILRSKEAGFTDHLTKPVNCQRLKGLIHDVLEK